MNLAKVAVWVLLATSPSLAVSVSAKSSGTTSPVSVAGVASSSHPITGWAIYVDSALAFRKNTSSSNIAQYVSMSKGTHSVTVKAWDSAGGSGSAKLTINLAGSSGSGGGTGTTSSIPTPPASAKKWTNLDQMGGWHGCDMCANGVTATFWFKQAVSSPSLDGKSMLGYIKGGYQRWADDLFVKEFGDQRSANHVRFDISFRWSAPKTKQPNGRYVVQGMEFDTLFLDDSFKYWFGTQCSYGSGWWDIWNMKGRYWQHTSIPCQKWPPDSWHTVTFYGTRDRNTKYVHFVALRVDGKEFKLDKWMPAAPVAAGHNFKFQWEQNTDLYGDPWYMWVDKLTVAVW